MESIAEAEASTAESILNRAFDTSSVDDRTVSKNEAVVDTRFRTLIGWVATSAVAILVIAGVWGLVTDRGRGRIDPMPIADRVAAKTIAPIATLLLEENCVWPDDRDFGEGDRLQPGSIELKSGAAVLRFEGGAELVMVGPAQIDLKSAARIVVHYGDVVVRADDGAEGFAVVTPTSEVIDLGTEFAVKVKRDGKTEVHVLDGEVSYRKIDAPEELVKILHAGEGISIDEKGQPVSVPMSSPRFRDYVRRINPRSRADLLTAYEGFNYSPGVLALDQSAVGIGWAGPWRKRLPSERTLPSEDSSPGHFEIVHGQMNVTWPVPGGRMGMLKVPAGNVYYVRPLEHSINLDRDGVTYFSLMVRETSRPEGRKRASERLRLTFRELDDYYTQYLSFGHGTGYQPYVRTGADLLFASPMVLPPEQTTLWIGKVVSRADGEDEIFFRVYGESDALGYAEPATWHVASRGIRLSSHFDCVLLSSEGMTERLIDELRIGPTWRSVAPITETVE
ncbi:FecR domain-containing protein [Stieleria maiorica]|nr:FecR domain-containing protein [Stieleria maiorica]